MPCKISVLVQFPNDGKRLRRVVRPNLDPFDTTGLPLALHHNYEDRAGSGASSPAPPAQRPHAQPQILVRANIAGVLPLHPVVHATASGAPPHPQTEPAGNSDDLPPGHAKGVLRA